MLFRGSFWELLGFLFLFEGLVRFFWGVFDRLIGSFEVIIKSFHLFHGDGWKSSLPSLSVFELEEFFAEILIRKEPFLQVMFSTESLPEPWLVNLRWMRCLILIDFNDYLIEFFLSHCVFINIDDFHMTLTSCIKLISELSLGFITIFREIYLRWVILVGRFEITAMLG